MKTKFDRKFLTAGLLALSLSFTLVLAGCGNTTANSSQPGSESPASDVSNAPSESPSASGSQATGATFQAGTWLSDLGQYWFFDPDGATGRTASLEDGTGVGFTYTLDGHQASFAMGGADSSQSCDVTQGEGTLTFQWEDGGTERLTYVSQQGSGQFQFHSNRELCDLALAYCKKQNGAQNNENLTAAAQTNEDGTVTIQVYENLGDHNSTCAWYTVDRTTAQGSDGNGQAVDLNS